jgi:hypothetical protein
VLHSNIPVVYSDSAMAYFSLVQMNFSHGHKGDSMLQRKANLVIENLKM